jgi:hypothetical protein
MLNCCGVPVPSLDLLAYSHSLNNNPPILREGRGDRGTTFMRRALAGATSAGSATQGRRVPQAR